MSGWKRPVRSSGSAATPSEPLERGVGTPHPSFAQEMLPCGTHLGSRDGSLSRAIAARPARGVISRRRSAVFRLERLEDRTVLSTLHGTNCADSGPGSLRQPSSTPPTPATRSTSPRTSTHHPDQRRAGDHQEPGHRGSGRNKLTISGNDASRVFDISPGETVTIAGLTITDGLADGNAPVIPSLGGGILNSRQPDALPTMSCLITRPSATPAIDPGAASTAAPSAVASRISVR